MKAAKKPFVVEIKNKRRLARAERSIWAKVDLRAAGEKLAIESDAGVPACPLDVPAAQVIDDLNS